MRFDRITVNAVMIGVECIYSLILLIASARKRNKTMMSAPFIAYCTCTTLSLLCGFLEWSCLIDTWFFRILVVTEYALVYLTTVCFLWYVSTYAYALKHPEVSVRKRTEKWKINLLIVYGICIITLFLSSMWTGWFYRFSDKGYEGLTFYYPIIYALGCVLGIAIIWIVIKNHKILGVERTIIFLAYVIIPMILFFTEYLIQINLGYTAMALTLFVIYVRVDNAQNELLVEQKVKLMEKEAEMSGLKLELMMSQIQPHFLYNTLFSIAHLCTTDPEEAEKATNEFAVYLRSNLQSIGENQPVSFESEMEHVEQFLRIERRRFRNRLNVVYEIKENQFLIPALTLQTLVENAVRYGVKAKIEPTTVIISTEKTDHEYLVKVTDDGPGFDVHKQPSEDRRHIGLSGAQYRLTEMMGGYLEVDSTIGKGTVVTIHIPVTK